MIPWTWEDPSSHPSQGSAQWGTLYSRVIAGLPVSCSVWPGTVLSARLSSPQCVIHHYFLQSLTQRPAHMACRFPAPRWPVVRALLLFLPSPVGRDSSCSLQDKLSWLWILKSSVWILISFCLQGPWAIMQRFPINPHYIQAQHINNFPLKIKGLPATKSCGKLA